MKKDYYGREVEILDFDDTKTSQVKKQDSIIKPTSLKDENEVKENKKLVRKFSLNPLKQKLNITSFKPVLLVALFIFCFFTTIQYFFGWDLFQIYVHKVTPEYKTVSAAYTLATDGKNLTFYNDNTFKYVFDTVVLTGNYTKNNVAYNLTIDKEVCSLEIKNQLLLTSCNMLLSQNEIDQKKKNTTYQKIFFERNVDFTTMKNSFLTYVNGLSVVNKWPSLKSSEIISIQNCYTTDALKTLSCNVSYYVEPSDDVNKTAWRENGTVVGTKIKKRKQAVFKKDANGYQFVS